MLFIVNLSPKYLFLINARKDSGTFEVYRLDLVLASCT